MLTFYLLRHGQTEGNAQAIALGQADAPLTQKGKNDIIVLSEYFKKIPFSVIYSSDLGRAFMSAYLLLQSLDRPLKIKNPPELREINYGVYNYTLREKLIKLCPQYKTEVSFVFPEGESILQVQKRVISFILDLEKKHQNETILIVTHGRPIRGLISYFTHKNLNEFLNERITHNYLGKFVINEGKLVEYEIIND